MKKIKSIGTIEMPSEFVSKINELVDAVNHLLSVDEWIRPEQTQEPERKIDCSNMTHRSWEDCPYCKKKPAKNEIS